jgi:hypothetical protein
MVVLFKMFYSGCPVQAVMFCWPSLGSPVLAVLFFASLFFAVLFSVLSCPVLVLLFFYSLRCNVLVVLFFVAPALAFFSLFCSVFHVLCIFRLSFTDTASPELAVLFWLSCFGCPVSVFLFRCPFLSDLFFFLLACSVCPVLLVPLLLCCSGCTFVPVFFWLSCSRCPFLPVHFWHSLSCYLHFAVEFRAGSLP